MFLWLGKAVGGRVLSADRFNYKKPSANACGDRKAFRGEPRGRLGDFLLGDAWGAVSTHGPSNQVSMMSLPRRLKILARNPLWAFSGPNGNGRETPDCDPACLSRDG